MELRDEAIHQLERRRLFRRHLAAYVIVNAFLVVIWYFASGHGYFWPGWVIAGWGIAVLANAWYVYGRRGGAITEADIARETQRLAGASGGERAGADDESQGHDADERRDGTNG